MVKTEALIVALIGLALVVWTVITPGTQTLAAFIGGFVFGSAGIVFFLEVRR